MVFDLAITGPAGPDTQAKRCEGFGFIFVVPPNSRISNQKYKNRNPSPVSVTGVLAEVGRAGLCAGAGRPRQRAWPPCPFCSRLVWSQFAEVSGVLGVGIGVGSPNCSPWAADTCVGGGGQRCVAAVDRCHRRAGLRAAGEAPRPESRDTASWLFFFWEGGGVVGRGD